MEEPNLKASLEAHEIQLSTKQTKLIRQYCKMLWEANQNVNLTRHTDSATFVARDLADVLKLSQLLPENQEILDIGSGGGVPGVVLALVRPDLEISLCESVGKKAAVLKSMIEKLELPVVLYHDRAEKVLQDMRFDACVARAVGPMWKLLTWLDESWLNAHRLLAFKGPRWAEEVTEAKSRGLTKGLIIKPVAKYPLHSTDQDAEALNSFIIEAKRAIG